MNIIPYGDRGVLLSTLTDTERERLLRELDHALPRDCSEFVLGYDSLLLVGATVSDLHPWLKRALKARGKRAKKANCHTVSVHYDGADLRAVAKACKLSVAEVVERHSAPLYTVRMMGFSPGFPYLDGLDPRLHIERRHSPRNQIAPGSVAIGGPHAGIYSVASPGGWHLLGRTNCPLFKPEAAIGTHPDPNKVFALGVGDQVRFQPIVDK